MPKVPPGEVSTDGLGGGAGAGEPSNSPDGAGVEEPSDSAGGTPSGRDGDDDLVGTGLLK